MSKMNQCLRPRARTGLALRNLAACASVRIGASAGSRGLKTAGIGASYIQYPFEVQPEMTTPRGQKTNYIFAQHNAGSKFVMINRPEALNALNQDMVRDLDRLYRRVQDNPLVGLVLLYGGGDKAFCAGGDVRKLVEGGMRSRSDKAPQMDFFREVMCTCHVHPNVRFTHISNHTCVHT